MPREILLEVLEAFYSKEVQRNFRGPDTVPDPEILLLAMCELARREKSVVDIATRNFRQIREACLRKVWKDFASPCSPRRQELEESRSEKSADVVHQAPSGTASEAEEASRELQMLHGASSEIGYVSKTLSEVEKVWRSLADKGQNKRTSERISDIKEFLTAMNLFPLAHTVPSRVALLRGAGNAIVPPLAAEFIKACEEATSEMRVADVREQ